MREERERERGREREGEGGRERGRERVDSVNHDYLFMVKVMLGVFVKECIIFLYSFSTSCSHSLHSPPPHRTRKYWVILELMISWESVSVRMKSMGVVIALK